MRSAVAFLSLPFLLYVFFLAYCALNLAKRNGKLEAMPQPAKACAFAILAIAVALDVVFNVTLGSLLFLEPPSSLLFTARCSSHLYESGWRGRLARWFCDGWLNPIEPGHCE